MKHSLSIGKNNLTKSLYELILVDPYPAVILVVVFSDQYHRFDRVCNASLSIR